MLMRASRWLLIGAVSAALIASAWALADVVAKDSSGVLVRQGTPHQALFAVAFEGSEGLAVGAAGELLASSDAGATWRTQSVPTQASLLGVSMRNGHAVVVGLSGVVLVRDAAGNWSVATSGTTERLFAVDLDGRGAVVAVGAFGRLLRSTDGGLQWTSIAPDWTQEYTEQGLEPHLYDVALADDGSILVVGEFGLVIQSADGGASWKVRRKDEASLFAIDLGADGVGYAVGQGGVIARTADGGARWSEVASGSMANLLDVRRTPRGRVVVTAMRDMLESEDGMSWRRIAWDDFGSGWYAGVATANSNEATPVIVVGHAGRIVTLSR